MALCRVQVVIPRCTTGNENVAVGCDAYVCIQAAGRDDNHASRDKRERRAAM